MMIYKELFSCTIRVLIIQVTCTWAESTVEDRDHHKYTGVPYYVWLIVAGLTFVFNVLLCACFMSIRRQVVYCNSCKQLHREETSSSQTLIQQDNYEGRCSDDQPIISEGIIIDCNSEKRPTNQMSCYLPTTPYTTVNPPIYANGRKVNINTKTPATCHESTDGEPSEGLLIDFSEGGSTFNEYGIYPGSYKTLADELLESDESAIYDMDPKLYGQQTHIADMDHKTYVQQIHSRNMYNSATFNGEITSYRSTGHTSDWLNDSGNYHSFEYTQENTNWDEFPLNDESFAVYCR